MRRLLSLFSTGLFGAALLIGVTLTSAPPATAATIAATTACSNGVDNTPGLGVICEVTIANAITALGGSATVTVRECHGAAGDPEAACTVQTSVLPEPVSAVNQCNDATNGGGGTLRCSVQVTNTFVGVSGTSIAVTVNQCVGSGDGIGAGCEPFPATTSGATITQCNGSANGGTLVRLTCTASGTQAPGHPITITQCNDSTNGGGALVICSASITNIVVDSSESATPTASPGASAAAVTTATGSGTTDTPSSSPSLPDTSTAGTELVPGSSGVALSLAALLLGALALLGVSSAPRNARRG